MAGGGWDGVLGRDARPGGLAGPGGRGRPSERTLRLEGHRPDRPLLGPGRDAPLRRRLEELEAIRADLTKAQAAELERIERDLHDGAGRMVALGLSCNSILLRKSSALPRV